LKTVGQAAAVAEAPQCPGAPRRTHLIVATVAFAVAIAALTWATISASTVGRFNDFYREAWPAYQALIHGHMLGFVQTGPTYVGSLVLRAPIAVIPSLWAGSPREIYFASALPCMLAVACFCTWLAAQPRRGGAVGTGSGVSPIFWCVCNPVTLIALFGGHPEEVLGATLCVGAVILAVGDRPGWAGFLVALAVINKSWALVAVPVVFVVMPGSRRAGVVSFLVTAAVVLIPITIARETAGGGGTASVAASQIGSLFNPPQLLWWFGPNAWIVQKARGLIVALAFACGALWWYLRGRGTERRQVSLPDALLLLALVFLIRAAFDPWDNVYYNLPFLFALIAYEFSSGRMPILTIVMTVLLLIVVPVSGVIHGSGDLHAAVYAIVAVPMLAWMAVAVFRPAHLPATRKLSVRRRVGTNGAPAA
jgi:hypothetical protein